MAHDSPNQLKKKRKEKTTTNIPPQNHADKV